MSLVSIVVPVYNNGASLEPLHLRLSQLAAKQPRHSFEFIFVDDGSIDDSFRRLECIAEQDSRVWVIKFSRNFGSNAAILAGLGQARGDCAAFLAADLQDPPESLSEMLRHWEQGTPIVLARRRDRQGDPLLTRLSAYLFNFLFTRLVFRDFSPQGIGFFLVDRQVVNVLVEASEKNSHLIALVLWSGFQRAVVEYDRVERIHGKSQWTLGKKLKYFVDAFVGFSYLPLRLSSASGFVLAAIGAIYGIIVVLLRLTGGIPVQGWTALTIIVLFTSGVQLLMLGVIGEYLWRNFDATRRRPPFIIAAKSHYERT